MTLLSAALPLSTPVNVRDLGGIVIEGGTVRPGVAVRADDLSVVTREYADELVADGLSTIIDLRSREEVNFTGRGAFGAQPVAYHHLPLMASLGASMKDEREFERPSEFGLSYARMYVRAAPSLVTALSIIAFAPGTVAFHCTAGKDRTGVLAASMLLALGASDAEIVADYGRSGPNIDAIHERSRPVMGVLMAQLGIDLDAAARAAADDKPFDEFAMAQMLDVVRKGYGDPLAPLREAGLSDGLVAALREKAQLA